MATAVNGVIGTDGVVPVYNPEGRWCFWALSEIWLGKEGTNRYVPKVNDYVVDYTTFETFRVDYLDPITLIPTLTSVSPYTKDDTLTDDDVLFGVGPGTQADTYRVYIDTSVTPAVMAVDIRLKVGGSMASYAKIFQGSDLTSTGKVISKVYDSNGVFVSENIPLELVAIDSHVNYSIKVLSVCHTTEALTDGEVVTAVIYGDNGNVLSKRQLLVENTAFIRSLNTSTKYVTGIDLSSAFSSLTTDKTIEFPINITVNSLNLMGVVNYSDGSTLELPVDGTKFSIKGLQQYVSSIVGQRIKLVLSYALGANEVAYTGVGVKNKYVTENYELVTVNPNYSYTVKLFGYPDYQGDALGYTMRWYLMNLDRNVCFDVTPYVKFAENTGAFNPKAYGILQRKSVNIDLSTISGAYKPFIHTQVVDITLYQPSSDQTPWTIAQESVDGVAPYGTNLWANVLAPNKIRINADATTQAEWLTRVYSATYPLTDPRTETSAPAPTHFILMADGLTVEYNIEFWEDALTVPFSVADQKFVGIKFISRTSTTDLQLAMAGMMMIGSA